MDRSTLTSENAVAFALVFMVAYKTAYSSQRIIFKKAFYLLHLIYLPLKSLITSGMGVLIGHPF